jgi:hypothetical protein
MCHCRPDFDHLSYLHGMPRLLYFRPVWQMPFFQYFYFFINAGAMVGQITMTFAEKVCSLNQSSIRHINTHKV